MLDVKANKWNGHHGSVGMFKVEEIAWRWQGGVLCRGPGQNMCFVVTMLRGEVLAPALIPASRMVGGCWMPGGCWKTLAFGNPVLPSQSCVGALVMSGLDSTQESSSHPPLAVSEQRSDRTLFRYFKLCLNTNIMKNLSPLGTEYWTTDFPLTGYMILEKVTGHSLDLNFWSLK